MSQSATASSNQPTAALAHIWGKYRDFATTSRKKKVQLGSWCYRELILGITGAVFGVLCLVTYMVLNKSKWSWTAGWIAVINTVTASITAYAYANRYQYSIVSYQVTSNRLEMLNTRWKTDADTGKRYQFIRDCEDDISIENSAWLSELIHKAPENVNG